MQLVCYIPVAFNTAVSNDSVVIGLLYMAYPNGCLHKFTFLPRLWPCPVRGALALVYCSVKCHCCCPCDVVLAEFAHCLQCWHGTTSLSQHVT